MAVLDGLLVGVSIAGACGWIVWFVRDAIAAGRRGGCGGKGCGCGGKFAIVRKEPGRLIREE